MAKELWTNEAMDSVLESLADFLEVVTLFIMSPFCPVEMPGDPDNGEVE